MASSTSYPFYITLDSTAGLLLGQHVYIQISAAALGDELLRIPEGYILDVAMDEETFLTTGSVWGVNPETMTLARLPVTLGEYDPTYGTYVILDGITAEDYLADPADSGVKEGAAVHLLGELEYMGQTEPVPTTLPADTGEADMPGQTEPSQEIDLTPVPPQDDEPMDAPVYSGSLVMPTEDPEKQ